MKIRKLTVVLALLGAMTVLGFASAFGERASILRFYSGRNSLTCGAGYRESAPVQLQGLRHAVSNFYITSLVSSGTVGGYVSKRITYHRLIGDFVVGNMLNGGQLRELFAKTPCAFRRR